MADSIRTRVPARSANLNAARREKDDEFYTLYSDIEAEVLAYAGCLAGRRVYCNCDDPDRSMFVRFFDANFDALGLAGLTATCFVRGGHGTFYERTRYGRTSSGNLSGDGDFRSLECLDILSGSDVAVTNPPFSLFREYVRTVLSSGRHILAVGSMNAATCREIFTYIQSGRLWLGRGHPKSFLRPDGSLAKFGNVVWFTDLDAAWRHEGISFSGATYAGHEDLYPAYDNYDAVEVGRVHMIPDDYAGVMGVPVTFLEKYRPEQFEILGLSRKTGMGLRSTKDYAGWLEYRPDGTPTGATGAKARGNPMLAGVPPRGNYYSDGVSTAHSLYGRIFIRRRP